MSFSNFDDALKRLKDVRDAALLRQEVIRLTHELDEKEKTHQQEVKKHDEQIKKLQRMLSENEIQSERLKRKLVKYNKQNYSIEEFEELVEQRFIDKVNDTINQRVKEKVVDELPKILKSEVSRYPYECSALTRSIIDSSSLEKMNKLLQQKHSWPAWFRGEVEKEAAKIAQGYYNDEFWRQVQIKASEELDNLKKKAWPEYINRNITSFLQQNLQMQLQDLTTEIIVTCLSCGNNHQVSITSEDVAKLITRGFMVYTCPHSKGWFRPKMKITLADLLLTITAGSNNEPEHPRAHTQFFRYVKADPNMHHEREVE